MKFSGLCACGVCHFGLGVGFGFGETEGRGLGAPFQKTTGENEPTKSAVETLILASRSGFYLWFHGL